MSVGQNTFLLGGLLVCGLGLPQASFGISGCNNGYLMGTYNADITSLNFQRVLQSLNSTSAGGTSGASGTSGTSGTSGSSGAIGAVGSSGSTGAIASSGAAGAAGAIGGLGGTTSSLAGNTPGLGRFYFDGAGNIVGMQTTSSGST